MSTEGITFWTLAAVLVAGSLATVLSKNLFHSVLYLALALITTAGLFLQLQSEFLAAVQVLLYAGGVVTLMVFAIMLTERLVGREISQMNRTIMPGFLISLLSFLGIYVFFLKTSLPRERPPLREDQVLGIARELLGRFVLPFELLAILFVAALLGALFFARKED